MKTVYYLHCDRQVRPHIYILYLSIRLYTVHVTYSELSCRDTRPTVTSIVVIIKFNIQTFKTARPYSCPWKGRCLFHIPLVGFCNLSWQRPNRNVLCDEEYGWTCIKTLIPVHHNLLTISTTHCSEQFVTEDHYRLNKKPSYCWDSQPFVAIFRT